MTDDAPDFRWQSFPVCVSMITPQKGSNSALEFLLSRGYPTQAHGLTQFKQILKHLTFNAPWYFQSIEGLGDMYAQSTDQSMGYKTKDIVLNISTLEAIDLRIFELASIDFK